ncbi:MAG: hypothetical protein L0Y71_09515 [Gemmataceae bacterium]|nr:hypothetical protein [Gemmataceae bacterium]
MSVDAAKTFVAKARETAAKIDKKLGRFYIDFIKSKSKKAPTSKDIAELRDVLAEMGELIRAYEPVKDAVVKMKEAHADWGEHMKFLAKIK